MVWTLEEVDNYSGLIKAQNLLYSFGAGKCSVGRNCIPVTF